MSNEQQSLVGSIINWSFKIVLSVCAWLAVMTFVDMKDQLKSMGVDVKEVARDQQGFKNDLIRLEGKIELHSSEIFDLKNRK